MFINEIFDEAYGSGMDVRIEAHGIRGMDRRPWRKVFKNVEALEAWCEKYDAEVYATREIDASEARNKMPAMREASVASSDPNFTGAEQLEIGDPVIICGNVEYAGETGNIIGFGKDKRFVVVSLDHHGKHSFHSSDVEYNDNDDEEMFGEASLDDSEAYNRSYANDDYEEEEEFSNGDYVEDEQDQGGEVFVLSQYEPGTRRCWIGDKQGRGWYISPSRLKKVTDQGRIRRYFGKDNGGYDDDEEYEPNFDESRSLYKAPRKGSVAYNAMMKRKENDKKPEVIKHIEKIGNNDHMVGNAKVKHDESAVPQSRIQKQGPAGQFRGTDKAPARNKLVGEGPEEHYAKDPSGYTRNMHTNRLVGQHWSAVGDKPKGRYAKRLARYDAERAEREAKAKPKMEAKGINKKVRIISGPAKGTVGHIGEVRNGLFKGAPKTYTVYYGDHQAIQCSKEQLRLVKDEPMNEFTDSTSVQVGQLANHGLIGNVRVLSIKGTVAEVSAMKGGKHYKVQVSSLHTGHVKEDGDEGNPADAVTMDVPLLIRMLEYAREDAKTDMDLHNVAEKLIALSKNGGTLSMDAYNSIVDGEGNGN